MYKNKFREKLCTKRMQEMERSKGKKRRDWSREIERDNLRAVATEVRFEFCQ